MRVKSIIAALLFGLLFSFVAKGLTIDQINSINCTDAAKTANTNIYFTTTDARARYYLRWVGTIPYDYGNLIAKNKKSRSGQFMEDNDPGNPPGAIELSDDWDSTHPSSLILIPTKAPTVYRGVLSGEINVNNKWVSIFAHPMTCRLTLISHAMLYWLAAGTPPKVRPESR